MPRFTESRIQWLCEQAKQAKTEEDLEVALEELQAALREHISLAKVSLEAQAEAVKLLDARAPNEEFHVVKKRAKRKP